MRQEHITVASFCTKHDEFDVRFLMNGGETEQLEKCFDLHLERIMVASPAVVGL